MCEWPTGCTERDRVTHRQKYQRKLRKIKTNKKKSRFLWTASPAGDRAPLLWRTRRWDIPLEALTEVESIWNGLAHFSSQKECVGSWNWKEMNEFLTFRLWGFWNFQLMPLDVYVGGLSWTRMWWLFWHWGGWVVFSWCCLPSVCYICRNHIWLTKVLVTWTEESFLFGSAALRSVTCGWSISRWRHTCLSVECPHLASHPSSSPYRFLQYTCLGINFFIPNFTSTLWFRVLYFWEKNCSSFPFFGGDGRGVKILAIFFLFAQMLCRKTWGEIREDKSFLTQFTSVWTNSSRGLGMGEGRRVKENKTQVVFVLINILKTVKYKYK